MFTGIIQEIGTVESIHYQGGRARLMLEAGKVAAQVKIGDSVAVSGVCLTVVRIDGSRLEFDMVLTTLKRSALSRLVKGSAVNLEPALRLGDPLGGHLVSGHVDGVGKVRTVDRKPGEVRIRVDAPKEVLQFLLERGSVAVEGISLTVAKLHADGFEVAVIPHTLAETTLNDLRPGLPVNLEGDLIGRWVAKYMAQTGTGKGITLERLQEEGY